MWKGNNMMGIVNSKFQRWIKLTKKTLPRFLRMIFVYQSLPKTIKQIQNIHSFSGISNCELKLQYHKLLPKWYPINLKKSQHKFVQNMLQSKSCGIVQLSKPKGIPFTTWLKKHPKKSQQKYMQNKMFQVVDQFHHNGFVHFLPDQNHWYIYKEKPYLLHSDYACSYDDPHDILLDQVKPNTNWKEWNIDRWIVRAAFQHKNLNKTKSLQSQMHLLTKDKLQKMGIEKPCLFAVGLLQLIH